jgi:hypothetical protein
MDQSLILKPHPRVWTGLFGISAQSRDPSPEAITKLFKMLVDHLHQFTLPAHTYGRKNGKQPVGAGTGRLTMEEINRGKNRTATEWVTERESKAGAAHMVSYGLLALCFTSYFRM